MNTNTDFKKWSNLFTHAEWAEDYANCTTFQEYVTYKKAYVTFLSKSHLKKGCTCNHQRHYGQCNLYLGCVECDGRIEEAMDAQWDNQF